MKKIFFMGLMMFFILSNKSFAQSDRALNLDDDDSLTLGATGISDFFTVETWIKPDDFNQTGYIFEFRDNPNSIRLVKMVDGSVRIEHKANPSIYYAFTGAGLLTIGSWAHLAMVVDTGNTVYSPDKVALFVDGVQFPLNFNVAVWPAVSLGTGKVSIYDIGSSVDDYRLWDVARTPSEISGNYGTEIVSGLANLIRGYNFNEGTASGNNTAISNLTDISASGINAVWYGAKSGSVSNIVSAGAPTIYTTNTILDFGTYIPPTPTATSLILQNTGSTILSITGASFTSGINYQFSGPAPTFPIYILPGYSANIDVQFNPASTSGSSITDDLTVYNNDTPLLINLTGLYPPPATTTCTWDGTAWSPYAPSYSEDAVIDGTYPSGAGAIHANNLIINSGRTVTLGTAADLIDVNNTFTNNGILYIACVATTPKTIQGIGSVIPVDPQIFPNGGALPNGTINTAYSPQTLNLDQDPAATWQVIGGTLPGTLTLDPSTGIISGNTLSATGTFNFTVGAQSGSTTCGDTVNFSITITGPNTWNGTSWSAGAPPSPTTDAIINGDYATTKNGDLICRDLTINSGTLYVFAGNNVNVNGALNNLSIIQRECVANFTFKTVTNFGTYNYIYPQITPSVPNGVIGNPYTANLSVTQITNPLWTFYGGTLPPGITLTGGTLTGTPTTTGAYTFLVKASTMAMSCSTSAVSITMVVTSLPDPNLTINNLSKTYGDPAFKVKTFSASNGAIAYSVSPTNGCATIDANTGLVTINCAGPVSQITVQAIQEASTYYGSDTATATMFLFKAVPTISIDNIGILLGDTAAKITYTSNSDGVASYIQVTHDTSVAKVSSTGKITSVKEGKFTTTITLSETDKYLGISEEVDLQVFASLQPPKANPDSVNIIVGQDTTFNILANDVGYTGKIVPTLTDIDLENEGIQIKYYDPAGGTFLLSPSGDITFQPFTGVIGKVKMSYTVTDERGQVSAPAIVTINVIQPGATPALKATELFTPNGDGLNDAFVIGYINKEKTNFLKLYDRSGYEVYSENDYNNNWSGKLSNGKNIEEGIYYFIFSENDGERETKGIIEIKR